MVTGYKDNNCYSNIVNLKYLVLESYHYSREWGIEKRMWVLHVKPQTQAVGLGLGLKYALKAVITDK